MSLFVRKINRNNWPTIPTPVPDIGSDAITGCMRTAGNSMSLYEINSEADADEAFLALVSNFDSIETFDIMLMDRAQFTALGMNLIQSPGVTPVQSLRNTHWDVTDLTYNKLAPIAGYMLTCFQADKHDRRTKGKLKTILKKAVTEGRLDPSTLKEKVRNELSI